MMKRSVDLEEMFYDILKINKFIEILRDSEEPILEFTVEEEELVKKRMLAVFVENSN